MTFVPGVPEDVVNLIRTQAISQYATVSAQGIPIDTPTFVFPSADLSTLDVATGLAYPAKAERARRNPKAGLLYEGGPDQPVVSVVGMAAVCDSNLQANLERYVEETIIGPPISPDIIDWSITRRAVWYLTRIIICITPTHIRWWKNPAAMDTPPQEWRAPASAIFPKSDPVPQGKASEAPAWPTPSWQELAQSALDRGATGHLTLLDPEGYPAPLPAHDIQRIAPGFRMRVPKGAPWSQGKANLTFWGKESFVGEATVEDGVTILHVERALPVLALVADPAQVLQPTPETRARLMKRLEVETKRRGQPIPTVPPRPPAPTAGARIRAVRLTGQDQGMASRREI